MTYVYVRMHDLTEHKNPHQIAVLKFFVESLYHRETISQCYVFGFVPVPTRVRDIAMAGLEIFSRLHHKDNKDGPKFIREVDTMPNGQAPYVVSKKRRNYYELQSAEIASYLRDTYLDLKYVYDSVGLGETGEIQLNPADKKMLEASLGLGIFSFILWGLTFVFFILRRCGCM